MSKVSIFDFSCSTDASRFDHCSLVLMAQLSDSVAAFGGILGDLSGTSKSFYCSLAFWRICRLSAASSTAST